MGEWEVAQLRPSLRPAMAPGSAHPVPGLCSAFQGRILPLDTSQSRRQGCAVTGGQAGRRALTPSDFLSGKTQVAPPAVKLQ